MSREILLARFLSDPEDPEIFPDATAYELLLRQARSANLLSRVACLFDKVADPSAHPKRMWPHLESATAVCAANHRSVRWEVRQLQKILAAEGIPVCLLKGAAYVIGGVGASSGRVFSDVDILIPKDSLGKAERLLIHNHWMCTNLDPYDQKYYRIWMHELPPFQHLKRGTTLDVHHTIIPPTARIKLDIDKIWENAIEVEGQKALYVPAPTDLVLHSAVHLFHDGELENGLRDLSDIDLLLRDFSAEQDFWQELSTRAVELGLGRPFYYALRYTTRVLETPVPQWVEDASTKFAPGKKLLVFMDALFLRALAPDHASCNDRWTGLARWMLFVRSHWLRMPPLLLAQHLIRKGFKRWKSRDYLQKA